MLRNAAPTSWDSNTRWVSGRSFLAGEQIRERDHHLTRHVRLGRKQLVEIDTAIGDVVQERPESQAGYCPGSRACRVQGSARNGLSSFRLACIASPASEFRTTSNAVEPFPDLRREAHMARVETVASAPAARATVRRASLLAVPSARAFLSLAIWIAARPTPPAAPCTRTSSPARVWPPLHERIPRPWRRRRGSSPRPRGSCPAAQGRNCHAGSVTWEEKASAAKPITASPTLCCRHGRDRHAPQCPHIRSRAPLSSCRHQADHRRGCRGPPARRGN